MPLIVDGSHWHVLQDGDALKRGGIAGYIHKVSDGSGGADATWPMCRDRALAAGLPVSGYHFYQFSVSAYQNASAFLRHYSGADRCALPPILDMECSASAFQRGAQTSALLEACHRIEDATGRVPMIYSGRYWMAAYIRSVPELLRYPFWLASYPKNDQTPPERLRTPAAPAPWSRAVLWQYTSNWNAPGMSGLVDCSTITQSDLDTLLAHHTPTPVPVPKPVPIPDPGDFLMALSAAQQQELLVAAKAAAWNATLVENRVKPIDGGADYLPRFRDEFAEIHRLITALNVKVDAADARSAAIEAKQDEILGLLNAVKATVPPA